MFYIYLADRNIQLKYALKYRLRAKETTNVNDIFI